MKCITCLNENKLIGLADYQIDGTTYCADHARRIMETKDGKAKDKTKEEKSSKKGE